MRAHLLLWISLYQTPAYALHRQIALYHRTTLIMVKFETILNTLTGIVVIQSVLIVVTNSLVFVLFAKCKKLRRKSNYCLVSLAVADILPALVVVPLFAACNYMHIQRYCDAMHVTQRCLYYAMILHILLATVDRYLKIRNPFRHRTLITSGRVIGTLAIIWLVSLTYSLVMIPVLDNRPDQEMIYEKITLVVMVCIPFVIILVLNVHTRWLVSKRANASRRLANNGVETRPKQQRTVLVYLAMATISFIFGPLLYFKLSVLRISYHVWLIVFFESLRFSVHFITPLLYTFFKTDFKNAFMAMIHGRSQRDDIYTANTSLRTLSNRSSGSATGRMVSHENTANEPLQNSNVEEKQQ